MLAMFTTGVLLWLLYGLAQASTPMILANGATLAMAIFLLVMRFRQN